MHILIALIGIIGFIAAWYWRLKMLSGAARDGVDAAKTVANLPRKMAFQRKARKGGTQVVEDPREAAAIIMLEVAHARGPLTERQSAAIRAEIMQHFEFSEPEANELITQAGWLARDSGAPHVIVSRMAGFLQSDRHLGPKELVDMDGMLVAVSEAEGTPTRDQLDLISVFRNKTGLQV